jgi:ABC-type sugar transport system ATPase subunit
MEENMDNMPIQEHTTVMRIEGITKVYPGTIAVEDISMFFERGKIHGIIGKNGAGKTTLVSILSGVISPTEGEILIGGRSYKSLSRMEAKDLGIDIVTQEPEVISRATIYETLFLPDYPKTRNHIIDWKFMRERTKEILDELNLDINVEIRMADLSISLQQLFAIIKSFYITKAPLIVLDESSASLSESDREVLFSIIREHKDRHSIIYISHRTDEILEICDVVTVLRDGKVVCTEPISQLDEKKISEHIVGDGKRVLIEESMDRVKSTQDVETVLELEKLSYFGRYDGIDITLRKGEIIGLAGLRGSGRTEIMKAVAGIDPPMSGTIRVKGVPSQFSRPDQAIDKGVAYLPEEREHEGLVSIMSVESNINLIALDRLKNKMGILSRRKRDEAANSLVKKFEIKCHTIHQDIRYLSGGNKQKTIFGKIYSTKPQIYLLDEPTKGIDISTKDVLLKMVRDELSLHAGIIMSAPSIDDLIKICDRILVLFEGRIIDEFERNEFDEKDIYMGIQGVAKERVLHNVD